MKIGRLVKFVAFSALLLLILALQPIFFPIIVAVGHYMLCSIEDIYFKKRRAELFDYGVATVMSKVTHMLYGVHGFDTTDVYVVIVRFGLDHF